MSIDNEQLSEAEVSYDVFRISMGESFAPFATVSVAERNIEVMVSWAKDNLPNGIASLILQGGWEVSFNACLAAGTLTRDLNWRSKADRIAAFKDITKYMPAAEFKLRLLEDPEFKRLAEMEDN
jgi:hypothetical protein